MENCWTFVSYAHIIVQLMAMGYVLYRFARPFMKNKHGAVCSGIAWFVTMLGLYIIPFEINNFTAYGIGISAAFFVMCRADHRNFRQKIYIAVTFFALRWLSVYIITIVVVTVLFQNIRARQEEKMQNELLSAQVDSTEKHIAQVESLYQDLRSVRHDMANHILTLERLYAGDKAEEAKAYGVELKNVLSEVAGEIKSGNPVTDVILQEWKKEAEKKKIRFQSDFYYPQYSRINAFDISVILNNALQNAMENATLPSENTDGDTAYISVHSYHRDNAYMMEICNSFTGDLQWDLENELPVTAKRQTEGHGYGLANIRRVAGKYSGGIAIDVKDGEFRISITK